MWRKRERKSRQYLEKVTFTYIYMSGFGKGLIVLRAVLHKLNLLIYTTKSCAFGWKNIEIFTSHQIHINCQVDAVSRSEQSITILKRSNCNRINIINNFSKKLHAGSSSAVICNCGIGLQETAPAMSYQFRDTN